MMRFEKRTRSLVKLTSHSSIATLAAIAASLVAGCSRPTVGSKPAPIVTGVNKNLASAGGTTKSGGSSSATPAGPAVTAWGTIKGRIVWDGEAPPAKTLNADKDTTHCTQKGPVPDETLVVDSATKGVRDVYVFLKSPRGIHPSLPQDAAAAGKAFDDDFAKANGFSIGDLGKKVGAGFKLRDLKAPTLVDQDLCKYVPHAKAVREGWKVLMLNPEPVAHNVKTTSSDTRNENNKNMPPNTFEKMTFYPTANPIRMECSIHPWMKGSLMVFPHPYFAVTGNDGSFEIKNVPAGDNNVLIRVGSSWIDPKTGAAGASFNKGASLTVPANGELAVGTGGELKIKDLK